MILKLNFKYVHVTPLILKYIDLHLASAQCQHIKNQCVDLGFR